MLQTLHRALRYQKHRLRFLMIIQPAKSVPFPLAYSQGGIGSSPFKFPVKFPTMCLSAQVIHGKGDSSDSTRAVSLVSVSQTAVSFSVSGGGGAYSLVIGY